MTIQRAAAQRLWTGTGIVASRLAKRAAGTTWPVRIGAAVVAWKAGPAILDQAHQQPWTMPAIGAGWAWAAWRASDPGKINNPSPAPTPPDTDTPLTSTGSGPEGEATGGGGEGFTIIDDPTNPARAIVIHKEHAA